jgi:hypothetical protein
MLGRESGAIPWRLIAFSKNALAPARARTVCGTFFRDLSTASPCEGTCGQQPNRRPRWTRCGALGTTLRVRKRTPWGRLPIRSSEWGSRTGSLVPYLTSPNLTRLSSSTNTSIGLTVGVPTMTTLTGTDSIAAVGTIGKVVYAPAALTLQYQFDQPGRFHIYLTSAQT